MMMNKSPIFSQTQESFSEEMFRRFARGRQHAARLYAQFFRMGKMGVEWAEVQAQSLVQEMIEASDWAVAEMSCFEQEAETGKFLLRFADGLESESVLIPMASGTTLCLSSQVGCKMGCAFCETGKMGLIRHLSAEEIVQQVFWARFGLGQAVRNLVFMGMGEPFDNYDAVMQAVKVLTDPAGLGFGLSRITISTSGRVDGILRMAREADPALNLAVSVNAPDDETRRKLMPVNKEWGMKELYAAMLEYCAHPRREILVEYVLIAGVNESLAAADLLAEYLRGLRVKVNLIPYNPQRRDRFAPPGEEVREAFLQRMRAAGYQTLLRGTKGQRIRAACGQLGNVEMRRRIVGFRQNGLGSTLKN
jgi:23S rRNA (adenine2503-C2)-methyltransferase